MNLNKEEKKMLAKANKKPYIKLRHLLEDNDYKKLNKDQLEFIIGNKLSFRDYNSLQGLSAKNKAELLWNEWHLQLLEAKLLPDQASGFYNIENTIEDRKKLKDISYNALYKDTAFRKFTLEGLQNVISNFVSNATFHLLPGSDVKQKAELLYEDLHSKFRKTAHVHDTVSESYKKAV